MGIAYGPARRGGGGGRSARLRVVSFQGDGAAESSATVPKQKLLDTSARYGYLRDQHGGSALAGEGAGLLLWHEQEAAKAKQAYELANDLSEWEMEFCRWTDRETVEFISGRPGKHADGFCHPTVAEKALH